MPPPGFCEVDLVAHDGGDPGGEFCQTLDLTCVEAGWTEVRAFATRLSASVNRLRDVATLPHHLGLVFLAPMTSQGVLPLVFRPVWARS